VRINATEIINACMWHAIHLSEDYKAVRAMRMWHLSKMIYD